MPKDLAPVYIVSHTHWDREWYWPFRRFRVNLERVVHQVLEELESDPEFRHFLLDGQAVLLEDYLGVRPEDRRRLAALVQAGKLAVGPWYVLPDEFLVSGEATVRNLLTGHRIANAFGACQKVGYLPDSFGHIAQLPQILRRAGIDSFVFTRGHGDEAAELGLEFTWRAPDGSEVLAVHQCEGYCNAGSLGHAELWHAHTQRAVDPERAVTRVREIFAEMYDRSNGNIWLLCNGCDHLPPQADLAVVMQALREAFPEKEFRHASLAEFLTAVRASGCAGKVYTGELRGGREHPILSGVWSARMPLKQLNDVCQTLLADQVEPLLAYARFAHGRDYPQGLLRDAWKLLLKNHPHDSICGCSTDEVHREMMARFAGITAAGEQMARNALTSLAPTFGREPAGDRGTVLCVFNPLPITRTAILERTVVLQPLGYDMEKLQLYDEAGRPVPFKVVERLVVERFWGVDYRTELTAEQQQAAFAAYREHFGPRILKGEEEAGRHDTFLRIQFAARDLPPLGHALFHLTDGAPPAPPETAAPVPTSPTELTDSVLVAENLLENTFFRVHLRPDGTFDVLDKTSNYLYRGLNVLEDVEDIGDEYDHCATDNPEIITSLGMDGGLRVVEDTGLRGTLEARLAMDLPRGVVPDRTRRTRREREQVECEVCVRVTLMAHCPRVDVALEFDNQAQDHRLRALFPTGLITDTLVSDGHFLVNRRPITPGTTGVSWVQPPSQTLPQQDFSLLEDGAHGLAILNRGLPEIAALPDQHGHVTLALTLLRCVGWLSRDDLASRRQANAGPTVFTPDAQCPGRHLFQYAVVPFAGDWLGADVLGISRRFHVAPLVVQGVADGCVPGGAGLVGKTSARTAITAVKRQEERDTLIVRVYNLTGEKVAETLTFGRDCRSGWRTNLLEERQEELIAFSPRELGLEMGPHEIVTVEVMFSE